MKVFWTESAAVPAPKGFAIHLDGRPLRTPSKAALLVPTELLANAIAAEWQAQSDNVNPITMPLTRAANTVIDRISLHRDAVVAEIAQYGETDLLCYRAPNPDRLIALQAQAWDPLLDWAAVELDANLQVTSGLMHCLQPQDSLDALRNAVAHHTVWQLSGLHDLVTLSGSLIIGLAVSKRHLSAEAAWPISRIDEAWNIEEWGEDAEAAALADRKRTDFLNAERLLSLLGPSSGA
ncbi:MAG: ATP12 family protein [Pseudomonadota bacterium]